MSDMMRLQNGTRDYQNQLNQNKNLYNHDTGVRNRVNDENESGVKRKLANKAKECETCKERRYQDGSNDPGVSFKNPTKLTPDEAKTEVISHEREHYTREASKAEREGKEIVSNTISVFTSICPECGKAYVSGGETRTVTRRKAEEQLGFTKDFYDKTVGKHRAKAIDAQV